MKSALLAIGLGLASAATACGDNRLAPPDAPATPDVPEVVPECHTVPQPPGAFATAADFGPAVAGTLRGWVPDGRWFFTGVNVSSSISSVHFAPSGAGTLVVDRDASSPLATIDDDEVFQSITEVLQGDPYIIAKRISNLRSDGTLRGQRAVCEGGSCRVCTAKLERATHNANEGEGDHLTLLGQLNDPSWGPGYTFNVRVVGTLAYLIRQDGLHIIETSDPHAPVELGHYRRAGDGYSNDVKLVEAGAKRYALIADYPVDIVDVTDPAAPAFVGNITEDAHTVFTETRAGQTLAYFGNYDANCPVYDVTDPVHPAKLGTFHTAGSLVHDLYVENSIAYLNAWDDGFQIVDYSTPATPVRLGQWAPTPTLTSHSNWLATAASGKRVSLHGEEAYGAHMTLVDAEPTSPTFMGSLGEWKTRDYVSIHNIMAFGSTAYFSYYQDGIRVLDVSNPAAPVQLGYYNTWDPQADYTTSDFFEGSVGLDVDLARKLIFVADSPRGLLVLSDETAVAN